MIVLALAKHTGFQLAEVGAALAAIAGAPLVLAAVLPSANRLGAIVGGVALAAGSVLLVIAMRWGKFG